MEALGLLIFARSGMRGIGGKAFVQVPKPLGIDEGPQDPPNLVGGLAALQGAQKSKVDYAVDVSVDAAFELRLIGCIGQEQAHHVEDLVASDDKPRLPARSIELGELLAQQGESQADGEAQLPSSDEARQLRLSHDLRPLAQVCDAFRVVENKLEPNDGDVVAHPSLGGNEGLPERRRDLAVHDASHQADQDDWQIIRARSAHEWTPGAAFASSGRAAVRAKTTRGMVACMRRPVSSVHTTVW